MSCLDSVVFSGLYVSVDLFCVTHSKTATLLYRYRQLDSIPEAERSEVCHSSSSYIVFNFPFLRFFAVSSVLFLFSVADSEFHRAQACYVLYCIRHEQGLYWALGQFLTAFPCRTLPPEYATILNYLNVIVCFLSFFSFFLFFFFLFFLSFFYFLSFFLFYLFFFYFIFIFIFYFYFLFYFILFIYLFIYFFFFLGS
jgi:hypothetical protein